MMAWLTDIELDAVKELLNQGVGNAAASLSEMIDDQIVLSVPSVEFIERSAAAAKLMSITPDTVSAVRESFDGPFWGEAMLIFPQEHSMELVRALLRDSVPLERLSELEQEALTEIGNVILNACLSSLADLLCCQLECEIPYTVTGPAEEILGVPDRKSEITPGETPEPHHIVMFLQVDFLVRKKNIQGYLSFMFDVNAIHAFRAQVVAFLDRVG